MTAVTVASAGPRAATEVKPLSVAERLDDLPLTRLHIAIVALCTLGLAADIGEVALSNTFSAIFLAPPYHASRGEVSLLLAAVFAGGALGAPVFGWWADRFGRRTALQTALAVLFFSALAVAWSADIFWMTMFRFVSGLALGAYPPLTAAYLTDLLPPSRRGLAIMLCGALAFLGAPAMIFLIRWLTPLEPLGVEGWRWALIAGAAITAATAGLFFLVPESPRWLAALGRTDEAERACRRLDAAAGLAASPFALTQPAAGAALDPVKTDQVKIGQVKIGFAAIAETPRHVRRVLLLGALYALGPWATIGFPLLSTAVMVQKGFRVGDSLLFAGISMFGPTLGIGIVAFFVDRIERRLALMLAAAAMIAIGLGFAADQALTPLIVLGIGFNLASAVYSAVLLLYGAELFPTNLRAFATSASWGVGRVVSALVPLVLLPLLGAQGVTAMFGLIAAALLTSIVLILLAGPPGLAKQPVE